MSIEQRAIQGTAVFRSRTMLNQFNKQQLKNISKGSWSISSITMSDSQGKQMREILPFLIASDVASIEIYSMQRIWGESIFKLIRHIQFRQLKKINLADNNLHNIEMLCTIQAEALEELRIFGNQIIGLNSLRKGKFNALKQLAIRCNPIVAFQKIAELQVSQEMGCLALEMFPDEHIIGETLGMLVKLNTKKIKRLWAINRQRIMPPSIKRMMAKRLFKLK